MKNRKSFSFVGLIVLSLIVSSFMLEEGQLSMPGYYFEKPDYSPFVWYDEKEKERGVKLFLDQDNRNKLSEIVTRLRSNPHDQTEQLKLKNFSPTIAFDISNNCNFNYTLIAIKCTIQGYETTSIIIERPKPGQVEVNSIEYRLLLRPRPDNVVRSRSFSEGNQTSRLPTNNMLTVKNSATTRGAIKITLMIDPIYIDGYNPSTTGLIKKGEAKFDFTLEKSSDPNVTKVLQTPEKLVFVIM